MRFSELQERKTRVLTVGLSVEEFALVAPCLDREEFDVDRFPGGQGAMELVARLAVDVLLIRYPLPDMVLPPFLQAVRKGPCRHSPLVLLAGGESLNEAQRYVGRGANRVLSLDSPARELQATVSRLLNVAPRKTLRSFTQLRFKLKDSDWIDGRPENLSATGLLLETEHRPPRGTPVDFELILPAIERPVVGRAEVARHTLVGRERVRGMGLRIVSFKGDSQRDYETFLKGRLRG